MPWPYVRVRLCSVTGRSFIETDERIELLLVWELPSTIFYCYKETRMPPKIWSLSFGTLSQTLNWKFRHGKWKVLSKKTCRRSSLWMVDALWTVGRNALTPYFDLSYNLYLQLRSSGQDFDYHSK